MILWLDDLFSGTVQKELRNRHKNFTSGLICPDPVFAMVLVSHSRREGTDN